MNKQGLAALIHIVCSIEGLIILGLALYLSITISLWWLFLLILLLGTAPSTHFEILKKYELL